MENKIIIEKINLNKRITGYNYLISLNEKEVKELTTLNKMLQDQVTKGVSIERTRIFIEIIRNDRKIFELQADTESKKEYIHILKKQIELTK